MGNHVPFVPIPLDAYAYYKIITNLLSLKVIQLYMYVTLKLYNCMSILVLVEVHTIKLKLILHIKLHIKLKSLLRYHFLILS